MKPDNFGCVANKLKVASGHYVDLLEPTPDSIDLYSIAMGLAQTCRFGGQCPEFYSVAEHCYLATSQAIADGVRGDALRAILLHDAAEAYLGDVIRPLKMLLPEYALLEERMERAVEQQFGISFEAHESDVQHYDRMMLKAEKEFFWGCDGSRWEGFEEVPVCDVPFACWSPIEARVSFLKLAQHVGIDLCRSSEESPAG